jgi:ATP-dependent RNA helicase HelY
MAVNLITAFTRVRAREVLETSFAQFQADRSVVHLARTIRDRELSLSGYEKSMNCHLGDFTNYARLRRDISDLERDLSQTRPRDRKANDLRQLPGRNELEKKLAQTKHSLKAHSCHRCPERESHARWGERWWKLRRETDAVIDQIESRTNQVAKTFDRICEVLVMFDYLTRDLQGELEVTEAGTRLAMIYGERDLLVAESLRAGIWDELDAATLSAIVATLVFESRRDDEHQQPKLPKGKFLDVLHQTDDLWASLESAAKKHKLKGSEPLDPGVSFAVHRWVSGATLDSVLFDSDLLVGDFIRLSKQIIDLLEQLSRAANDPLSATANDAIDRMKRGIVAYSYYV